MSRQNRLILVALVISLVQVTGCYYHEQAFKGTILDIDTKQPIEGAVVVAEYKKAALGIAPEAMSSIINVRETLTDKEGNFNIASYTTLLRPLSWKIPTIFVIFKPGYASPEVESRHFTGDELKEEQERQWYWAKDLKYKLRGRGIVELPKLRTREERSKAMPSPVEDSEHKTYWYWKKQKQLIRLLNEENRNLGYGEYKIEEGK